MKFQSEKPFKHLSDSAQATECIISTFPATWGMIVLPEEGHYRVILKSTLNSQFQGRNIYMS